MPCGGISIDDTSDAQEAERATTIGTHSAESYNTVESCPNPSQNDPVRDDEAFSDTEAVDQWIDDTAPHCLQEPSRKDEARSDSEESCQSMDDTGRTARQSRTEEASKQNSSMEITVTICCRPQRQQKRPKRFEETDSPASMNRDVPLGSAKASPALPRADNKRLAPTRARKYAKDGAVRKLHAAILKGRNLGEKRRNLGKRKRVERPRWTTDDIRLVKQSRLVSFTGGT